MKELKKVNLFAGRFQPFHSGHLQCCEDAYKENGLPVVIMYIHNDKFDSKKPFDDTIIERELEIIRKNYNFIEAVLWLRLPQPVRMCRVLQEEGYQPVLWLSGEDRIDNYKKMLNKSACDKIENELNMQVPELYQTNRYSSATAVRQALKDDNKDEYIKLMPKGTDILYDEFKEQINMVKENKHIIKHSMKNLTDYLSENIK